MFNGQLPPHWEQKVRSECDTTETIFWFGQPRPYGLMILALPVCLFAIPWTAFAVFWIWSAAGQKIPDVRHPTPETLFPLFGLPFVFIGVVFLFMPLWAYLAGKKTAYVITNKRAIIFGGGWTSGIRSVDKENFKNMTRRDRSGGRGDILFNGLETVGRKGSVREVGLGDVENVKEVEMILRNVVSGEL